MSRTHLHDLRRRYGFSEALLSRLLDVSLRTIANTDSPPAVSGQIRRGLAQIARLCEALSEAMQPSFVGRWLDQPNEMLGNLKPVEAIERGELDLVWQIAEGLRDASHL